MSDEAPAPSGARPGRFDDLSARRVQRAVAKRVQAHVVRPLERGVFSRRPRAHMLHIGKTGGTAMKDVLASLPPDAGRYEIVAHRHVVRLPDVPPGDKAFFVVRDPVERFVSGFNSRLREGRPRYHTPWIPSEKEAFERFASADALGRSLFDDDAQEREAAHRAMISIWHVRDSYWDWFRSREYLESRLDDLLLIQWMPDLTATFGRLSEALGLPDGLQLPTDDLRAHRSPADVDRTVNGLAVANLQRWYARDYAFLDFCAGLDCFAGPSLTRPVIPSALVCAEPQVTISAPALDAPPVMTATARASEAAQAQAPIVPELPDANGGDVEIVA